MISYLKNVGQKFSNPYREQTVYHDLVAMWLKSTKLLRSEPSQILQ